MTFVADLELKERVRTAIDIVDLVGASLELRRQGRNYVARCPWHDDRRPSMMINVERQTWRCWVCDIGGDAFSFVMRRDGVSFPEAMRILAERAGIEIQATPTSKGGIEKADLLALMSWAETQFFQCLADAREAAAAREYLGGRGINDKSRQTFRIGFAPDGWSWLLDRAVAAGYATKLLEAAGLVRPRQGSTGFYDWFRGRLMFPIRDLQDRCIAFGGRILPSSSEDSPAKYINSPETPLFSKSRQLYGLSQARDPIQKAKNALVMEGYTDVIIAQQHGVTNSVAVLGTALGETHIRLLRRFTERVTLVLDGDAAGQKRADEVLELFVAADIDLRVMTLPNELDPADYLLQHGSEIFNKAVEIAPDAIDHKLHRLTDGVDLTHDTHQASRAMESLLEIVSRAPQSAELRVQQLLLRFAKTFGVPVDGLRQRLEQLREKANLITRRAMARKPSATQYAGPLESPFEPQLNVENATGVLSPPSDRLTGGDRELFELLIEAPQFAPQALELIDPEWLDTATARVMLDAFQRLELAGHHLDFATLMLVLDEPHLKATLVEIDQRVRDRAQSSVALSPVDLRWAMIVNRFQQTDCRHNANRVLAQLESNQLEAQEELEVLQQLIAAQRARHGLMSKSSS